MSPEGRFEFDRAYLDRLAAGDPDTEGHFTRYFGNLLSIKLRSRLRSSAQIEDARQETFLRVMKALRQPGGIQSPGGFGAFVNSVCNNVLFELYRSHSRTTPLEEEVGAALPDLLVDRRDPERALAIADSSRGRVLAERQNVNAPTRVTPVDLRRTAAQLDAVLLFYWIGDRSYAWQVTKDRIRLVPLPVTASQVDVLVQSYQRSLVTALADPLSAAASPGDEIYAKLIAPLAAGISSGSRVVIVPDGALTRINFESLPVPGPKRHYGSRTSRSRLRRRSAR